VHRSDACIYDEAWILVSIIKQNAYNPAKGLREYSMKDEHVLNSLCNLSLCSRSYKCDLCSTDAERQKQLGS
jgi:hypothetical protein